MIFIIKESIKIIFRSKLNFILNLFSLTFCIILILLSFILLNASNFLQQFVNESLTINVFIKDDTLPDYVENFKNKLIAQPFTDSLKYISKQEAEELFINETGEDFRKILDYNPLPASFIVYLNSNYSFTDSLNLVIKKIQSEEIVSDIVSRLDFIKRVVSLSEKFKIYIFILTGFMIIVSFYLVWSTVKLILNSKYEELETMKLVGAKLSTIKLPIIFNIILIGILAGIIVLYLLNFFIIFFEIDRSILIKILRFDLILIQIIILAIGPIIGLISTILALRKITLKIY